MYKVLLDGTVIYDPMTGIVLTEPVLELVQGKAGSFSFGVPPGNPGYGKIKKLVSTVEVLQDGESLFSGRVLSAEKDFYGVQSVTCEGELAYLLDSIQRPREYHDMTVRGFLQALIDSHNAQVEPAKQFEVGEVTVTDSNDSLYRYTNWETTLGDINDKLVSRLGGSIRIRHADGKRYLDYLADFDNTNTQVIAFGENLLDYAENTTAEDLATCIIPLGAAIENTDGDPQVLQKYTTCADANGGSDYVSDADAIKNYGQIFKVVHFDDVTKPANLKTKGERYLHETQFEQMTLTVTAVDKHLLSGDFERIKIGDRIRCLSKPHGMDRYFPVTARTIHLDAPEQDTIKLGDTVSVSYTERANKDNDAIYQQIDRIPSQSATLKLAQDNATALLTAATTGHVVVRPDEILIMDTDDSATAQHVWRWNVNGWGYSGAGINGPYKLAATMDGAIVADCITAGTMSAEHIRTGTLKSQDGTVDFDLDSGQLIVNGGSDVFAGRLYAGKRGLQITSKDGERPQVRLGGIELGGQITLDAYDSTGNHAGAASLDGSGIGVTDASGTRMAGITSNELLIGSYDNLLCRVSRGTFGGADAVNVWLGDGNKVVCFYAGSADTTQRTPFAWVNNDTLVVSRNVHIQGQTTLSGDLDLNGNNIVNAATN